MAVPPCPYPRGWFIRVRLPLPPLMDEYIIKLIRELDEGDGASFVRLCEEGWTRYGVTTNRIRDDILAQMMQGLVFEPSFNQFSVVEWWK